VDFSDIFKLLCLTLSFKLAAKRMPPFGFGAGRLLGKTAVQLLLVSHAFFQPEDSRRSSGYFDRHTNYSF
jgi:hypothetical protein